MATVRRVGSTIAVRFTRFEKLAGLLGDLDIPLTAVTGIEAVRDPLRHVRGNRGFRLGTAVPGLLAIGRFSRDGELNAVAVRRGQPAVRIRLTGQHYESVLVGAEDPEALAATLPGLT